MRTQLMIALLVIALVVVASVAMAAPPRGGMKWGPGMGFQGHLDKLTKELNLTPSQVSQIRQIHQDFVTSTQATRDDLRAKRQQMMTLWMADPIDANAIKALAADIDRDKAEIRDRGIDAKVSGLSVLTPDQRAKLRTMMQDMKGKMRMHQCPMMDDVP